MSFPHLAIVVNQISEPAKPAPIESNAFTYGSQLNETQDIKPNPGNIKVLNLMLQTLIQLAPLTVTQSLTKHPNSKIPSEATTKIKSCFVHH